MIQTKIAEEILNSIGADIEDRMEIYREAASAASGQLQALRKLEIFVKALKKNKTLDKPTIKIIEQELLRQIQEAERHTMGNASRKEAYDEVIAYLKRQHDKFKVE